MKLLELIAPGTNVEFARWTSKKLFLLTTWLGLSWNVTHAIPDGTNIIADSVVWNLVIKRRFVDSAVLAKRVLILVINFKNFHVFLNPCQDWAPLLNLTAWLGHAQLPNYWITLYWWKMSYRPSHSSYEKFFYNFQCLKRDNYDDTNSWTEN